MTKPALQPPLILLVWGLAVTAASAFAHFLAVATVPGQGHQGASMFVFLSGGALAVVIGLAHAKASRLVLAGLLACAIAYYQQHVPKQTNDPYWFARIHVAEDLLPRLTIGVFLLVTATRVGDTKRMGAAMVAWIYWDYWLKILWTHQIEVPPAESWLFSLERALAALAAVPPNAFLCGGTSAQSPTACEDLPLGYRVNTAGQRWSAVSALVFGLALAAATSGASTVAVSALSKRFAKVAPAKVTSQPEDLKLLQSEFDATKREYHRLQDMGRTKDADRVLTELKSLIERINRAKRVNGKEQRTKTSSGPRD